KNDLYRLRYGEIIGKDWDTVEEGFFTYAVKDSIVTLATYLEIRKQAVALVADFRRTSNDILPDAVEKFGLLTEAVQVQKAGALPKTAGTGRPTAGRFARHAEVALRQGLGDAVAAVRALCPDLFKTDKHGNLKHTTTGAPSKSKTLLLEQLQ